MNLAPSLLLRLWCLSGLLTSQANAEPTHYSYHFNYINYAEGKDMQVSMQWMIATGFGSGTDNSGSFKLQQFTMNDPIVIVLQYEDNRMVTWMLPQGFTWGSNFNEP